MATLPSVAIQSYLTFTAKRWGQFPTITLKNGASCAVVSVDPAALVLTIVSGTTTMAQIKTAVDAHVASSGFSASDLVTVSITTGHTTDAVKTLVGATLAGALAAAVKASVSIGGLVYTAKTAGTGGNSVRVKYTSGASLLVSVSTNDITVRLNSNSSSTNALIKAAVDGNTDAAALVAVASAGGSLARVPGTDAAPDFVALSGGAAAAPAVVVVQGLTLTSKTNDAAQNGATFTATAGATAGAEAVTVSGNNVSVQIQEGVSTVTQVQTALVGVSAVTDLYTPTGSASTAVRTVNATPLAGAVGPSLTGSLGYYQDSSVLTLSTTFQYQSFGNVMGALSVYNDEASGSKTVIWSYDGVNNHGSLLPGQSVQLLNANKGGIYLKEANGAPAYRIFAAAH